MVKDTSAPYPTPAGPAQLDVGTGPGRPLRQGRQARGLSLERVAAELRLALPTVESIEQDRYDQLPAPVFVTGYLRNYARLLDLDPEPLIQAYRAACPQSGTPPTRVNARGRSEIGSGHLAIRLVSLTVALALAGLVALWWQGHQPSLGLAEIAETTEAGPPLAEPEPISALETALDEGAGLAAAAGPSADPSAGPEPQPDTRPHGITGPAPSEAPWPGDRAPEAEAPGIVAMPAPVETVPSEGVASGRVELTFDGPCWVDIRDADRGYKLLGEMAKGDRRTLEGTPPYSIIIGNAAAATITIDGRPFDLARHARGNVARFTLDPTATRPR